MTPRLRGTPQRAAPHLRADHAGARIPWQLGGPAVIGATFLLIPLFALLARVPWRDLPSLLTDPAIRDALRLSLLCASAATVISVVVGVPLAWLLARSRRPGIGLVRALVTVPLVLPPVVGGVALLTAFGRQGIVGRWLDTALGITLPFTTTGVIMAETFVAMPFLVLIVEGALRTSDRGLDEAAATLGASRLRIALTVTLPLLGPSVLAGAVLTSARALGEFGATITFAGNFPGRTQTMPLAVYLAMESDPDAALALSFVLLLVCVLVLVTLRARWLPGGAR